MYAGGNNAQKTPLAESLNRFAANKIRDALQITGKALPCSVTKVMGSIVTVKFEVSTPNFTLPSATVPIAGSQYMFSPTQVGDRGVVFPADVNLGGISGLGGGVATFTVPANLSALTFFPIGNKSWNPADPNKVEIWGPDGVIIRSKNGKAKVTFTEDSVLLQYGDDAKVQLTDTGSVIGFGVNNVTVDAAGIHFNGPIAGGITGVGGIVDFGTTLVKGSNFQSGSTTLTGHHHLAPVGGNTGPALP